MFRSVTSLSTFSIDVPPMNASTMLRCPSAGTAAAVIEWPAPSSVSDLSIVIVPVTLETFIKSVTVSPVCSAHAMALASVV